MRVGNSARQRVRNPGESAEAEPKRVRQPLFRILVQHDTEPRLAGEVGDPAITGADHCRRPGDGAAVAQGADGGDHVRDDGATAPDGEQLVAAESDSRTGGEQESVGRHTR